MERKIKLFTGTLSEEKTSCDFIQQDSEAVAVLRHADTYLLLIGPVFSLGDTRKGVVKEDDDTYRLPNLVLVLKIPSSSSFSWL